MKGIVLAGGSGTRLAPMTKAVSKQLLPVYNKPAIYYPISILMLAGIREIIVISTPRDILLIKDLLGSGSNFGVDFSYLVQQEPKGIAEAFIIARDQIRDSQTCLILGDNLFYGQNLPHQIEKSASFKTGATIFGYHVPNPKDFGVIEFDDEENVVSLEEKPSQPKSNWVATGLYMYDSTVVDRAMSLKPSQRGELEITDLNKCYLKSNELRVQRLGRGTAWLDTGTPDSLLMSSVFVQTVEQRQGLKIACLEEIAYIKNFITKSELTKVIQKYPKSEYTNYLQTLITRDSK